MPTKLPARLNEPLQADRIWFNQAMQFDKGFFSEPAYNPDYFTFEKSRIIYPVEPERLTWQRAKLIRNQGNPHPSLWISRIDLFLITLEGDGWEKIYSANLAGMERQAYLRALDAMKNMTPEGATPDGQTYWRLIEELTADLLISTDADRAFVSPLLHHLQTGELSPLDPLEDSREQGKALFEKGFTSRKFGMTEGDRQFMREQSRLQEHNGIDLYLNWHGFVFEANR